MTARAGRRSRSCCACSRTTPTPTAPSQRAAGLDARDRALAQRLAYGTVQRVRTLDHGIDDARQAAGAQARPAGARGASARRVPARLPRGRAARGACNESVELVRAARLERAVAFTNAVMRRLVGGLAPAGRLAPGSDARRGRAQALLSGLGRRGLVARPRPRGSARADARAERAPGDRRPAATAARRATSQASPIPTCRARCTSTAWTRTRSPRA